jgi:hypothetical protein
MAMHYGFLPSRFFLIGPAFVSWNGMDGQKKGEQFQPSSLPLGCLLLRSLVTGVALQNLFPTDPRDQGPHPSHHHRLPLLFISFWLLVGSLLESRDPPNPKYPTGTSSIHPQAERETPAHAERRERDTRTRREARESSGRAKGEGARASLPRPKNREIRRPFRTPLPSPAKSSSLMQPGRGLEFLGSRRQAR